MPEIYERDLQPLERKADYDSKVVPAEWTDQHTRVWAGNADNKTFHPTGALEPLIWRAPHVLLVPAPMYHEFKRRKLGWMRINYEHWFAEESAAWRDYENDRGIHAQRRFAEMGVAAMDDNNPHLAQMVGQSPMHLDFIRAMVAGNEWVLGLPDPFTGKSYPKGYLPGWARDIWRSLQRRETYDNYVESMQVDRHRFAAQPVTPSEARDAAGVALPPVIQSETPGGLSAFTDNLGDDEDTARDLERRELLRQMAASEQLAELDDAPGDAPKAVAGAFGALPVQPLGGGDPLVPGKPAGKPKAK